MVTSGFAASQALSSTYAPRERSATFVRNQVIFKELMLQEGSCLCAGEGNAGKMKSANITEWTACSQACSGSSPQNACQRTVSVTSIFSPVL